MATGRVLTGASINHKIKFINTKQVRYQLDNQTTAIIRWDIARVRFLIASVRRLTMQGNKVSTRKNTGTSKTGTGTGRSWRQKATSTG